MILSKKHKFVFIKGKKIAGTSVEVLLSEVCGPEDIITPITPIDERNRLLKGKNTAQNYGVNQEVNRNYLSMLINNTTEQLGEIKVPKGIYYNHMAFSEISKLFGEIPNDWKIFAVERCPYRKIISFANMRLNFKKYKQTGRTMVSDLKTIKRYLQKVIDNRSIVNVRNIDLYKNNAGNVCAEILRFERLEEDINTLMSRFNITDYPKLEHYKKGLNSDNIDLFCIFSKRQLAIINEMFEDEFNSFSYSMIE